MSHSKPKLLLLDSNALLHRAWHAIPPLTSPDGTVVNAAYGITSVVLKIMKEEKPELFIACWDTATPTFRHKAYDAYKATRPEKEQALYDQIPIAKEILETMGIQSVAMDGYEADDLIGTFSRMGVKEGYHVRIVTGDRDSLQLINDDVDVLTFKKGVSETKLYDAALVKEEYGITPIQTIDWKAISGDSSDNIKGIKGIGDKGATELIAKFGSIEGAIKAAKDSETDFSASLRKKLIEGEKDGLFSKELVTIDCNVPIKKKLSSFSGGMNREAFMEMLAKYGFKSLIARVPEGEREEARREKREVRGERKRKRDTVGSFFEFGQESEVIHFLDEIKSSSEIAIYVESGAQGSLFGETVQGMMIGSKEISSFISFTLLQKPKVIGAVKRILEAEHPKKVCDDAKETMRLLEPLDVSLSGISHDILIAAYLLAAGERQTDLDMITMQELGHTLPAAQEERRRILVRTIFEVAERQRKRLKEDALESVMSEIELPLIPILRNMERVGVLLDIPYLKTLSKEATKERERLEREMREIVGHDFNPASPAQLSNLLFDELGLSTKGIKKGKTAFSTAASELEKLEDAHPIIRLIEHHREVSKLLSTYIDTLPRLVDQEGRVHTTFNQAIAATGRLSSSDPNLQNIPVRTEMGRRIRRAFITSPGMKLLSCDYSQIELRIAAALSRDKKMLSVFESGEDVHAATAAEIWSIPLEAVTKEQRRAAKAINFGILFGQGPQGLSRTAEIPYADAKEFIDRYFETFKGIKMYLEETKIMARANGYVETLFGRRRPIPEIVSGVHMVRAAAERMAINMPIQGTEADLMKLAMIKIDRELPSVCPSARMLLQVHDELMFEVPEKEVKKVAQFAQNTMATIKNIGCPVVVDTKAGDNWEEMDPVGL